MPCQYVSMLVGFCGSVSEFGGLNHRLDDVDDSKKNWPKRQKYWTIETKTASMLMQPPE